MNDVQRALVEKAVMVLGEYRATMEAAAAMWQKEAEEGKSETAVLLADNSRKEVCILKAVMRTLMDALAYTETEEKA